MIVSSKRKRDLHLPTGVPYYTVHQSGYLCLFRAHAERRQCVLRVSSHSPITPARPFPRQAPFGQGSPASNGTMSTLRLPPPFAVVSLPSLRLIPLAAAVCVPSLSATVQVSRLLFGPGRWSAGIDLLRLSARRLLALPGFQGTPLCLCHALRPRHAACPCHYGHARPLPQLRQGKLHGSRLLSWLHHMASAPTAYASRFGFPYTGKAGFRLPGKLYRTGFAYPLGSFRKFQLSVYLFAGNLLSRCPFPGATYS